MATYDAHVIEDEVQHRKRNCDLGLHIRLAVRLVLAHVIYRIEDLNALRLLRLIYFRQRKKNCLSLQMDQGQVRG